MSVRCLRHDSLDSVQASLGEFEPPPSRRLARRGRARCDGCGPEWLGAAGWGYFWHQGIFGCEGWIKGIFWAKCRAVPDREFEPPTSLRFGNVGVHMAGCA